MRNTRSRWGAVAKLLHWAVFVLIIAQTIIAFIADSMPLGMAKLAMLTRHKSIGMVVMLLVMIRLLWRWTNPTPALPSSTSHHERVIAGVSHAIMYALLFSIPLSGWLMSSARGFPVSVFGLFQLPDLVPRDKEMFEMLVETHSLLMWTLAGMLALHVAAACRHHFLLKDDVLRKMLPFIRIR